VGGRSSEEKGQGDIDILIGSFEVHPLCPDISRKRQVRPSSHPSLAVPYSFSRLAKCSLADGNNHGLDSRPSVRRPARGLLCERWQSRFIAKKSLRLSLNVGGFGQCRIISAPTPPTAIISPAKDTEIIRVRFRARTRFVEILHLRVRVQLATFDF